MDYRVGKVITCALLVLAFIAVIVSGNNSKQYQAKIDHDVDKVTVKLTGVSSSQDDYKYYVNCDYEITNNGKAAVRSVEFITTFKDKNGKTLVEIKSSVSTMSNGVPLYEGWTTYYSGEVKFSKMEYSTVEPFCDLDENSFANLTAQTTITYVSWSDGYRTKIE